MRFDPVGIDVHALARIACADVFDQRKLLFNVKLAESVVKAESPGKGGKLFPAVLGNQNALGHAGILEIGNELLGGFQRGVGNRDATDVAAGDHHVIVQRIGALFLVRNGLSPADKQLFCGERDVSAADIDLDAVARKLVEVADDFELVLPVRGVRKSLCYRLLGIIDGVGGKSKKSIGVQYIGLYRKELRAFLREYARLVEDQRPDAGELFERACLAEQGAETRRGENADKSDQRDRKHGGGRRGDHDDRQRAADRLSDGQMREQRSEDREQDGKADQDLQDKACRRGDLFAAFQLARTRFAGSIDGPCGLVRIAITQQLFGGEKRPFLNIVDQDLSDLVKDEHRGSVHGEADHERDNGDEQDNDGRGKIIAALHAVDHLKDDVIRGHKRCERKQNDLDGRRHAYGGRHRKNDRGDYQADHKETFGHFFCLYFCFFRAFSEVYVLAHLFPPPFFFAGTGDQALPSEPRT